MVVAPLFWLLSLPISERAFRMLCCVCVCVCFYYYSYFVQGTVPHLVATRCRRLSALSYDGLNPNGRAQGESIPGREDWGPVPTLFERDSASSQYGIGIRRGILV